MSNELLLLDQWLVCWGGCLCLHPTHHYGIWLPQRFPSCHETERRGVITRLFQKQRIYHDHFLRHIRGNQRCLQEGSAALYWQLGFSINHAVCICSPRIKRAFIQTALAHAENLNSASTRNSFYNQMVATTESRARWWIAVIWLVSWCLIHGVLELTAAPLCHSAAECWVTWD